MVIMEEQAAEIAAWVRAIAHVLGERDPHQNHYQSIWVALSQSFCLICCVRQWQGGEFGCISIVQELSRENNATKITGYLS